MSAAAVRSAFKFDLKDTFRLIVWIIMAAFTCGAFYNQKKQDVAAIQLAAAEHVGDDKREFAKTNARLTEVVDAMTKEKEVDREVAVALEGIRVQLRYINENVAYLREDARTRK